MVVLFSFVLDENSRIIGTERKIKRWVALKTDPYADIYHVGVE
jgi:hypothetical protein